MYTVYHIIVAFMQRSSRAAHMAFPMVGLDSEVGAVVMCPLDPIVTGIYVTINTFFCMEEQ